LSRENADQPNAKRQEHFTTQLLPRSCGGREMAGNTVAALCATCMKFMRRDA
jgi:hypothetical protein